MRASLVALLRLVAPLALSSVGALAAAGCTLERAPEDAGAPADGAMPVDGAADAADAARCTTAADCDDGLFCNGDETCTAGRCVGGARACDDGVSCTVDSCSEERLRCENRAPDADADGYGDAACVDGTGTPLGNDCDDGDDTRFPGNAEVCDDVGHDEDCDETTLGGLDADGDGVESDACCNPIPGGGRTCGTDCDDGRRQVNPAGTEVCDGIDDDCDGMIDDGVTVTVYEDADRDGHGDPARSSMACAGIAGLVSVGDDCDDTRVDRHPAQLEFCDGVDNDCDGTIDDDTGPVRWYGDSDGDGFGSATSGAVDSCAPVPGASLLGTDCDDARAAINPAAAELCDGRDNDCSGRPDYAIAPGDFEDDDSDGYVDIGCGAPLGVDCEDDNPAAGPGEPESCDGRDNDCDTSVDEDVTTYAWFLDADGDGYGTDDEGLVVSCLVIGGHVRRGGDCDDANAERNPDATETCSGRDEDCDGAVDEAPASDACVDTLGADHACVAGSCRSVGCLPGRTDCDGSSANGCETTLASDPLRCGSCSIACRTAPGASPVCSAGTCATLACSAGRFDCNGDLAVPTGDGCESSSVCPLCVTDASCDNGMVCDGAERCDTGTGACQPGAGPPDGDGDGQTPTACGGMDCDDARADVRTGGVEVCDGVDQNCNTFIDDGATDAATWYRDGDLDGAGDPASTVAACVAPSGHVATGTDCDDSRADIGPGRIETCDGLDQDCDTLVDEAAPTAPTWYRDFDGDGSGDPFNTAMDCVVPSGHVSNSNDCDDTRAAVRPGASEVCNGLDDDCDGLFDSSDPGVTDATTWFRDFDMDGAGDAGQTMRACAMPAGYRASAGDCDDMRSDVGPTAPEVCDGVDNDCDTLVDDADPSRGGGATWFRDFDGDGAGDPISTIAACTMPVGYLATGTDCDDTRAGVRPGAPEVCDGLDNDCDTMVDDGNPGGGGSCSTGLLGVCAAGTTLCSAGALTCSPSQTPSPEICDGLDNDCDGIVDDGNPGGGSSCSTGLPGVCAAGTTVCSAGAITCSQNQAPGPEICDGLDNDCDALLDSADPSVSGASTWYRDLDMDGAGNPGDTTFACFVPGGYVGNSTDCDDTRPDVQPGAPEVCNGIDNDCDAIVDEAPTDCGGGATCVAGMCQAPFPSTSADLSVVRTQGTCADGGDMVSYSVMALTPTTASLLGAPSPGCLVPGDEVLLLNLQGSGGPSPNVGNWELLTVASVAGGIVTFSSPKGGFYGDGASDDSNLGTGAGNQRVVLQRVPSYGAVTLAAGADYTASAWNGARGGVFAMRATSVSGSGRITMTGRGFRGGDRNFIPSSPGTAGESHIGLGVPQTAPNAGGGGGGGGDPCQPPGLGVGGGGGAYGGAAASSEFGAGCGGAAGSLYGDAALTRLFLGSGGGSGGTDNFLGDNPPGGMGGAGGGIVLLLAGGGVSSDVTSDGTVGEGDPTGMECTGVSTTACWDYSGPGGGGSGGSVRIDGPFTGLGSVAGGAGGNGFAGGAGDGGGGSIGRIVPSPAATVPPVTAGLIAHFNARVAGSLITSGSSVTSWNDLSGFNRNLGPTFAAPTVGTATIAGRPAVDFTAAGMVRSGPGIPLAPSASITVFVAMGARVPNQWGAIVHHGSRDGDWSIEQSGFDPADVSHFQSVNDNTGAELTLTPGTNYVLCGRITGATRYFSATTGGATAAATATGNSIAPSNLNFYVGASDANERSNAIIGEVVYYDRSLTDPERDAVIAYLTAAWGI